MKRKASSIPKGASATKQHIAAYFSVGVRTVENWMTDGMPFYKQRHVVRFDLEEVKQWLRAKAA
jgi:excisionase family DNA binding protein